MKHTQGPWHNTANTGIVARCPNQNGEDIATCLGERRIRNGGECKTYRRRT